MDFLCEEAARKHSPPLCLFADDDDGFSTDCRWLPSSPRRCDRGQLYATETRPASARLDYTKVQRTCEQRRTASSSGCGGGSSNGELFLYCTEELGSESTSGVGHFLLSNAHSNCPIEDATFAAHTSCSVNAAVVPSQLPPPPPPPHIHTCLQEVDAITSILTTITTPIMTTTVCPKSSLEEAISIPSSEKPPQDCSFALDSPPPASHLYHHWFHRRHSPPPHGEPHTFPPPLSSLLCDRPLMSSFKSNGRFILKRVADVSQSLFRSTRKDGRLRLDLLSSSPSDDDQCPSLFPANPSYAPLSAPNPNMDTGHGLQDLETSQLAISPHLNCCLNSPSSSPKWNFSTPPLSLYKTSMCPQALAKLMRSESTGPGPLVQVPKPHLPSSVHIIKGHRPDTETTSSCQQVARIPRVFALLNLHPVGLGLIILEFGASKFGEFVTLHGVYILKSLGFQCSRDGTVPNDHFLPNACGIREGELSRAKLSTY